MPYDINEAGDIVLTCPMAWSVLEKVNELKSALNVEPIMQATYLALHPDCESDTFFEGRTLWDKILQASREIEFIRLYMLIKHSNSYMYL
jgi:predicted membrane chloride channel (bestrophin family)